MPALSPDCLRLMAFALLLGFIASSGCGSSVQQIPPTKEVELLYKVQSGYEIAYSKLGHPPKDFAELQPHLNGIATEQELVSPNDKLPYVILYGVDTRQQSAGIPVVAYEQQGIEGTRRVLTAMGIESMDEATFRSRVPAAP
jgi:hypothetical protein